MQICLFGWGRGVNCGAGMMLRSAKPAANLHIKRGCEQVGLGEGDLTQDPGRSFREKIKILHPGAGKEGEGWVALAIPDLTFPHPGPLSVQSSSTPFPMKGEGHSVQIFRCKSGPFFSQNCNSPSLQTSSSGSFFAMDCLFWPS